MKTRALLVLFALLSLLISSPAEASDSGDLVQTTALTWAQEKDVMCGERVLCRSFVTAREGGDTFFGVISGGLTFEGVTAVLRNGETVNAALYTVVTERRNGNTSFTLHVSAAAAGGLLVIEYALRVNDRADTANRFTLVRAGDDPGEGGCLRLNGMKIFRGVLIPESGQINPLDGSCLCLTRDKTGLDRVAFRQREDDVYLACTAEECGHARHQYVVKTPRNGIIQLEGIPRGIYYLRETRPADGEETTAEPREITVTGDGQVICDGNEMSGGTVSMIHRAEPTGEPRRFSLLEFYRRGIRVMTVILCVLVGSRRYSA